MFAEEEAACLHTKLCVCALNEKSMAVLGVYALLYIQHLCTVKRIKKG